MYNREELNGFYKPLCNKMNDISALLKAHFAEYTATHGFFNGHYHKSQNGEYAMDFYPIPVISVMGLCDIELDYDSVTVTTKCTKNQTLEFEHTKLYGYHFEVYGVNDYLRDYGDESNTADFKELIKNSPENEFFYSFILSPNISASGVIDLLKTIQCCKFYY